MSGTHSILSPSAAHRWLACPGSLAAAKHLPPERNSEDAARGTLQHTLSETCLRRGGDPIGFLGTAHEVDGFKFTVDEEMCRNVGAYVNNIRRRTGRLMVEQHIDLAPVLGIPAQKGTADAIVLNRSTKTIEVHDAKFGFHRVDADANPQGLLYIAGALDFYSFYDKWEHAEFWIHQPRVDNFQTATYSIGEVQAFIDTVRPIATRAIAMYEGRIPIELTPGPKQCQWCPVRASCAARTKSIVDMFEVQPDEPAVAALGPEELSAALALVDHVETWCGDIRAEARRRAMEGSTVPGWKLVRGRKGKRFWSDPTAAESALSLLLDPAVMYEPRKLTTPAALEKVLRQDFESVERFVGQEEGALQLVPATDKRSEVVAVGAADFSVAKD